MSTPVLVSSPAVAAKATKTRNPSLPDKYGKFIQFAYYMMDNVLGEDFQMDRDAFLEKIKFFGSVEEQQILIQGFLTNAKEVNKTIKKIVTDRNKAIANANKPVKQPRAKKSTTSEGDEPPKRTRKPSTKKTVQTDETDMLNELVQQLTLEPSIPETIVVVKEDEVIVTETAKKPKKTATKKTKPPPPPEEDYLAAMTNELVPETFVSEPAVVTKPKRKTAKKESTNATVDAAVLTDLKNVPNTDIEITPITICGTTYFTDNNSQLYAYPVPTAKSIGKYLAETEELFLN